MHTVSMFSVFIIVLGDFYKEPMSGLHRLTMRVASLQLGRSTHLHQGASEAHGFHNHVTGEVPAHCPSHFPTLLLDHGPFRSTVKMFLGMGSVSFSVSRC